MYSSSSNAPACREVVQIGQIIERVHWKNSNATILYGDNKNYRLIKRLGAGNFGEAYLADNTLYNTRCVIKLFKKEYSQPMLLNEMIILQHLCNGPNIVKLYDVIKNDRNGYPALVMEYLEFVHYRYLVFTQLTKQDVQYYSKLLLQAIEYIHHHDIIHRDIKFSNFLINPKNRSLTVIDFGLATFHERGKNTLVSISLDPFLTIFS